MFKQWVTVNTGLQIVFLRFKSDYPGNIFLSWKNKPLIGDFVVFNTGTKPLVELPIEVIRESATILTKLTEYVPAMTIIISTGENYEVIMQKCRGDSVIEVTFFKGTPTPLPEYDLEDVPHLHGDLLFRL